LRADVRPHTLPLSKQRSASPPQPTPSLKGVDMNFRLMTKQFVPAAACLGFVGFAAAVTAAGPAQAATPSLPCPGNVAASVVVQGCLPSTQAPADSLDTRGPNQVPKVRGIPCTGSNIGTCIGLSRLPSPDVPQPDTSVRHSP
jgi:hypothetical protein